ncbi:MAG: cation-transporting P-type ATPase C [Candidatus Magnetoglobus multicellularis str. Araruama]|uniref:P-type Zn(2+) transporter n=1 Tax=Candidatus Magnetoglobus multicellularis str. Araruama TaxID=890399 RepID=A0A1V1P686_9BACT|nr:MAG: cation-transporting P-type ATPase C [Candidatus Magnetoglobus multicellularis str. Araruama]
MKNIKIIHTCNNRIRLQILALNNNHQAFSHLEKSMKILSGIQKVRTNPTNSCIVLNFDNHKIGQTAIMQELDAHVVKWLSEHQPNRKLIGSKHKKENNLFTALLNFLGISIVGLSLMIRPFFSKKILIQTPSSPLGLITMVSALPLMGKLIKDIKKRSLSSETILDVSVYATIMAGETLAAIEILWITHAGILLQAWITERSRNAISNIVKIGEKNLFIVKDGKEIEIPANQVKIGDIVRFNTGDKLAVDGHIVDGLAEIDEAPITGCSDPIEKANGNQVFAGSFVYQGEISVFAEKVGDQTYLAKIFQMVEDALENKAEIEGIAEQLANKLMKVDLAVTLTTLALTRDIRRSFSVMLVMACPCATVLAASTAISSALYLAARNHILIKGGRYLEEMGKVDTVCFDKTGTLTTNEPEMICLKNFSGMDEAELLQQIYSAEIHNDHPLAIGFKSAAIKSGIDVLRRESCQLIPGKGIEAIVDGNKILVGNQRLMEHFKIKTETFQTEISGFYQKSLSPVFIAINNKLSGIAGFDTLERENISFILDYLRMDGINSFVLITGDSEQSATPLCRRYAFDDCYHSILPENKAEIIASLKDRGKVVLMVGDGINDSLALAEADIGMAMGAGGSEIAIEASDIALVNDNLQALTYIRSLSHKTINTVYQNFWIAAGTDIIGVAMGALGYLSPLMAGSLHILHTLGILANSSRILLFKMP